jgi:hypothetical protein
MQSKQLITTFEQLPYDVIQPILAEAAYSTSDAIFRVSRLFRRILSTIFHNCGYYSREQKVMNSIFFKMLKTACQKLDNFRAQTPRPPIGIMAEQSEESPVCHNLTTTDFDFSKSLPCNVSQVSTKKRLPVYHSLIITNADLKKSLPCDASQVHTLLFSLTDEQYNDERFNKIARVVKFFTINKFPNLSSLVLNNVYCTNELLECFQEYNLEYFHIRYSSFDSYIDPKSDEWRCHLVKLATLSVKDLRIDISMRPESRDLILDLPPKTRNLTLKIDVMGFDSQSDHSFILMALIDINATNCKSPLNVQLFCDPLYSGILTLNPPKEPCTKEFICHALPQQFSLTPTPNWGVEVVKLYIHEYNLLRRTTFPKCLSPKYYDPKKPTSDDEDYIRMFSDKEINYGNCELEMFLNQNDKNS